MTPLAHQIAKQLTLPIKRRTFNDQADLLKSMDDVHCFECTRVVQAAAEFPFPKLIEAGSQLAFLPAPKTWLEYDDPGYEGGRQGFLLIENGDSAEIILAHRRSSVYFGRLALHNNRAFADDDVPYASAALAGMPAGSLKAVIAILYGLLAMINSPRVIGRRQHMPHRGLERDLIRAMQPAGSFPLHAWTEILLDVAPPQHLVDSGEFEAHLTGKRALHFVRAHLRLWNGELIFIKAHWRGDAALGIKQSRYVLHDSRDRPPTVLHKW